MKCEYIQKEFGAFLSDDLDEQKKADIRHHLGRCPDCRRDLERQKKMPGILHAWKGIDPSPHLYEKLESRIGSSESFLGKVFTFSFAKKAAFRLAEVAAVVCLTLVISDWLERPEPWRGEDLSAINVYLTEHQGAVLKTAAVELAPQTKALISVRPEDFLYYEHIDDFPQYSRPGVILRGPAKSAEKTPKPESRLISRGKFLDLSQARKVVDFEPAAPARLYPGYILDSIRKIADHNSLHLIYTNGVNTLSLFEQSLDGKSGLGAQDFREYAVYRHNRSDEYFGAITDKSIILAWKNGSVSFVLIGNEDMSRMMDLAQAVSTVNKESHGLPE